MRIYKEFFFEAAHFLPSAPAWLCIWRTSSRRSARCATRLTIASSTRSRDLRC